MARLVRSFTGRASSGVISVSGVKAGDKIEATIFDNGINTLGVFGEIILVDDEIIQNPNAGDLSASTLHVLLSREVMIS
jgi:hypothetical protein